MKKYFYLLAKTTKKLINFIFGISKNRMPKRGGRGGRQNIGAKRELVCKVEGETEYGQVLKNLGNKRLEVILFSNGKSLNCKIRGSLRAWIAIGEVVLVSMRDFQQDRADIIWKYSADEARKLKKLGEIPLDTKIQESDNSVASRGDNIEFVDKDMDGGNSGDEGFTHRNYDLPPTDSSDEEEEISKI